MPIARARPLRWRRRLPDPPAVYGRPVKPRWRELAGLFLCPEHDGRGVYGRRAARREAAKGDKADCSAPSLGSI